MALDLMLRQLDAVRAPTAEGTGKAAARALGISSNTLTNHLMAARHRPGVDTSEQAALLLTIRGELVVPGRG